MKKITALILTIIFIFTLTACAKKENLPENSTPSEPVQTVHTENGVEIDKNAFPENTVLKVEPIKSTDKKVSTVKSAIKNTAEVVAYEITAKSNNVAIQPNGTVSVLFPIPEIYNSEKHDIAVYYISDDGKTEKVPTTIDKKGISATLSHFSTYAVVVTLKEDVKDTSSKEDTTSNTSAPQAPVVKPTFTNVQIQEIIDTILFTNEIVYQWDYEKGIYSNNYKAFNPEDVFYFIYYMYRDISLDNYIKTEKNEQGYAYDVSLEIPINVLKQYSNDTFGYDYDFTTIGTKENDDDCLYYNQANNSIYYAVMGGFGKEPDDSYYYKSFTDNGDKTADCLLEFWEVDDTTYEKTKVLHTGVLTIKKLDNGNWKIVKFVKN